MEDRMKNTQDTQHKAYLAGYADGKAGRMFRHYYGEEPGDQARYARGYGKGLEEGAARVASALSQAEED
jgi:hypothetical protein